MKRVLSLLGIGTLALLVAVPANAKVVIKIKRLTIAEKKSETSSMEHVHDSRKSKVTEESGTLSFVFSMKA